MLLLDTMRDCTKYSKGTLMLAMCEHDDKSVYTNFKRLLNKIPNNIYIRKDIADTLKHVIYFYKNNYGVIVNKTIGKEMDNIYKLLCEYTKPGQTLLKGPPNSMNEFRGLSKDADGYYSIEYSGKYTTTYYYPKPFSLVELISIINNIWKIKKKYNIVIIGLYKFLNTIKTFHTFTLFRCQGSNGKPEDCFV